LARLRVARARARDAEDNASRGWFGIRPASVVREPGEPEPGETDEPQQPWAELLRTLTEQIAGGSNDAGTLAALGLGGLFGYGLGHSMRPPRHVGQKDMLRGAYRRMSEEILERGPDERRALEDAMVSVHCGVMCLAEALGLGQPTLEARIALARLCP